MSLKMYGKIIDGKLKYAPAELKNLEEYKEVIVDEPATLEGMYLEMDGWIEYDECIKPLWRVKPIK